VVGALWSSSSFESFSDVLLCVFLNFDIWLLSHHLSLHQLHRNWHLTSIPIPNTKRLLD
jgi:hypothetical protein